MDPQAIFTVTDLTQRVKGLLEADATLASVYVAGEISNYKLHSSGHLYLTLKDAGSVLKAVMFRGDARNLKFNLADGMHIIAHGRVSVFAPSGQHQLYIDNIQPDGVGALYLAFEQLKNELQKQGLFREEHKKPLPRFPRRIALITSPTGAAVQDMLRILGRRYPMARVRIVPVHVQGLEAPGEIRQAIAFVNHHRLADLIITGRGGGSLEDLWAFNDEGVARAIYDSQIPVISAVGHEPDVTIADFVADVRAATPSNAAELAVPDAAELLSGLHTTRARLIQGMQSQLKRQNQLVAVYAQKRVLQNPQNYLQDRRMLLAHLTDRLTAAAQRRVALKKERCIRLVSMLEAMNPLKVLARGYAVAQSADGHILTGPENLGVGDELTLRLARGGARCQVREVLQSQPMTKEAE